MIRTPVRHNLGVIPGLAIVAVATCDPSVGDSVVLGLVVVAPLLASNVTGPWAPTD